jgi:hypothetical protein
MCKSCFALCCILQYIGTKITDFAITSIKSLNSLNKALNIILTQFHSQIIFGSPFAYDWRENYSNDINNYRTDYN